MSGFGAKAYHKVAVQSSVAQSDPHQLVLLLFDGALAAVNEAIGHMQAGRVAERGVSISKAIRIVDEGLKVSLDRKAGGQLAFRLLDLYDYMTMRLLQANLRNNTAALDEVAKLMRDLRDAWTQIRPQQPAAASAVGAPAGAMSPPASPYGNDAASMPGHRLAVLG
jgi:flagellar protein FliS